MVSNDEAMYHLNLMFY